MTFKDVYDFAYKQGYIPIMQVLAHEMGKDAFIEMLKKAGAEFGAQHGKMLAKHFPKNDLAAFIAFMKREDRVSQHVWTFETIEETDITFEIKVTECLWADTFREADAADIGYATYCHADYAMAQAFNPKMKMIRTKTLMEGHDCCNHRYVMEE